MQQKLNWSLFSNADRNDLIESVKHIISKNDGCIMNFNMYSDLAISLSIEIEANKIEALHNELSLIAGISTLATDNLNLNSNKEWLIFLNISFNKGRGDLKNEIPEVPG